jgi:hypothetical protein
MLRSRAVSLMHFERHKSGPDMMTLMVMVIVMVMMVVMMVVMVMVKGEKVRVFIRESCDL